MSSAFGGGPGPTRGPRPPGRPWGSRSTAGPTYTPRSPTRPRSSRGFRAPSTSRSPGSIGGGNSNGRFTAASLDSLTAAIGAGSISAAGYDGIVWDIEEGDAGLSAAFAASFAAAKAQGLATLATTSHSAPYGIDDAAALMSGFFGDANIDYLSPQLYSTGEETENEYNELQGVSWADYVGCEAKVVPSIVAGSMYSDAQSYFAGKGVATSGYVQWAQP
jgi:hypothetical protein